MAINLPTVVPKKRTITIGADRTQRQTFKFGIDVMKQGVADVHAILRQTTADAVAEQMRANNDPQQVIVDGNPSKSIRQAERKVEVFFGSFLPRAAMAAVEKELRNQILKVTNPSTSEGHLSDIAASWQWILLTPAGSRTLSGPIDIPTFTRQDKLILVPRLPYASAVNNIAAKFHGKRFTAATVNAVRRITVFRSLNITSGTDERHQVKGEVSTYGTAWIAIRLARTRQRRGR